MLIISKNTLFFVLEMQKGKKYESMRSNIKLVMKVFAKCININLMLNFHTKMGLYLCI